MIRITCTNCGSSLNAKPELIGQVRKCPKCFEPIKIEAPGAAGVNPSVPPPLAAPVAAQPAESIAPQIAVNTGPALNTVGGTLIGSVARPVRLDPLNRYIICSPDRIIALWEQGKGWQVNVGSGFAGAKQSSSTIPDQGSFVLAELVIRPGESGGNHIQAMNLFKIGSRGSLMLLTREDYEILSRIDGAGSLTQAQKAILLTHLYRTFMADFMEQSQAVVEQLK